uniref:Uncharacterized protein n=1 Tax=Streptomyces sp. NBC_01393 TaxID=2903851 RepID=A0AAU3HQ73_9ACTN
MAVICNREPPQQKPEKKPQPVPEKKPQPVPGKKESERQAAAGNVYGLVDGPIATGSAHFMRAGSEIHLLYADLELDDLRQAAVRVSCARAAVEAALEEYEASHRIAQEIGFYDIHNEKIREARAGNKHVLEVLREAITRGLVSLDDSLVLSLAHAFDHSGEKELFSHFLGEVEKFSTELAEFDSASANEDTVQWQHFAWQTLTSFEHVRTYGQALAIINTYGLTREPSPIAVGSLGGSSREGTIHEWLLQYAPEPEQRGPA